MLTDVEIISQWINESRIRLIDSQVNKGLKASGKSAAALGVSVGESFGQLIDKAGYFYFQQFGRKAGKAPPVKEIYDWLEFQKYGITYSNDKQRLRIAFAIQRSIKMKGTYTHQRGSTNVVSDVFTPERISALSQAFAFKYASQTKSDIVTEFKP